MGFKLAHGRLTTRIFYEVLEKVSSRLASWKGEILNRPGRITLANSVLFAIAAYTMHVLLK